MLSYFALQNNGQNTCSISVLYTFYPFQDRQAEKPFIVHYASASPLKETLFLRGIPLTL